MQITMFRMKLLITFLNLRRFHGVSKDIDLIQIEIDATHPFICDSSFQA